MHGLHPLIIDLTLIAIYAAITTLIFKKLKQPMVLGYLLAGIFAGPYFNFVPTVTDRANLTLWADIGVIFLLFSLGLEFSFKKMISVGKSAMITANLKLPIRLRRQILSMKAVEILITHRQPRLGTKSQRPEMLQPMKCRHI